MDQFLLLFTRKEKPAMVEIQKIAGTLNIRTKRILLKVQKLNLTVRYSNDVPNLNKFEAETLVQSYALSKKVSEETRINAQKLLDQIRGIKQSKQEELLLPKMPKVYRTKEIESLKKVPKLKPSRYKILISISKGLEFVLKNSVHSLTSLYFKFVALFVAIGVQMHHSAVWFHRSAPESSSSWLAAIGFAFMLDLFVLVITLEGRLAIAKSFAILTFFSNMLYFQFWVEFKYTAQDYTNAISSIMISAMMAFILFSYTELFVRDRLQK